MELFIASSKPMSRIESIKSKKRQKINIFPFFIKFKTFVMYQVKLSGVFLGSFLPSKKRTFNRLKCYPSGGSLTLWEAPLRGLGTTAPMITPLEAL